MKWIYSEVYLKNVMHPDICIDDAGNVIGKIVFQAHNISDPVTFKAFYSDIIINMQGISTMEQYEAFYTKAKETIESKYKGN
jgi:hypothetical protein